MPKQRYEEIYHTIKAEIEKDVYPFQSLLPSENQLSARFGCSRNTVRRAYARLIDDGYVQAMQGKGVRCIYQPFEPSHFLSGEIETFREAATRNHLSYYTKVVLFTDLTVDERVRRHTGFAVGESIYYIQRVHYINGLPLILNHNYFLASATPGLTAEIAEQSIYDYLENTLHMSIINSLRAITVERITALDERYLTLNPEEYNCLAVVSSRTYNGDGVMFEYTASRHRPDYFRFTSTAVRRERSKTV